MKDFCIAAVISLFLILALMFGRAAYRVYFVYPNQTQSDEGCPINYTPIISEDAAKP